METKKKMKSTGPLNFGDRTVIRGGIKAKNITITTNGKTYMYKDNAVIEKNNVTVIGNGNTINGKKCEVIGNNNIINGKKCTVNGNDNIINGKKCTVIGHENVDNGSPTITTTNKPEVLLKPPAPTAQPPNIPKIEQPKQETATTIIYQNEIDTDGDVVMVTEMKPLVYVKENDAYFLNDVQLSPGLYHYGEKIPGCCIAGNILYTVDKTLYRLTTKAARDPFRTVDVWNPKYRTWNTHNGPIKQGGIRIMFPF